MLMHRSPMSALICLLFFLPNFSLTIAVNFPARYAPIDNFAINCGSSGNSTMPDGRVWIGDIGSKFSQLQQHKSKSVTSKAFRQLSDIVHLVPYMTARISRSQFSYTFEVNPGQKFVRLHFFPVSYPGFESSQAFFTVKAGPYTLLSNFSASLTASALGKKSFVREFCLNVVENQALTITFFPYPSSASDVAYAFINGIEIVSMPTGLYYTQGNDPGAVVVGQNYQFYIENNTALELVQRLNVGGSSISSIEDTGMYREWLEDSNHLIESSVVPMSTAIPVEYTSIPAYIAPQKVYQTAWSVGPTRNSIQMNNFTWKVPVDLGFIYLIRLHFCELVYGIKDRGQREFRVFINKQIAEDYADIIKWSGGNGIAVYRDYVAMMEGDRTESKRDLLIALQPHFHNADAILNGLEVFKLSNPDNNLAGPNAKPLVDAKTSKMPKPRKFASAFHWVNAIVNCIVVLITFVCVFVHQLRIWAENSRETNISQSFPKETCRRFSLSEMLSATSNFDDALTIGHGGFGKVYRGLIDLGATTVAIKRLNSTSKQGAHEFWTEIEMLSELRHTHLVSLIGYCDDCQEMILVYEYMAHGTLADHIYKVGRHHTGISNLSWEQRLNICIGAARGLNYLHAGTHQSVIHRDVKSTNILLDQKWVAKISDFGLSKMSSTTHSGSYVSTNVKGTFGYLDPEYFSTRRLTRKSDVYAFGVVLLEVLCGRRAVDMRLEEEQHSLALWAQHCIRDGIIHQIIDSHLLSQISPHCLKLFAEVAMKCLHSYSKHRPIMDDVVGSLQLALAAQQSSSSCTEEAINIGGAEIMQITGTVRLDHGTDLQSMESSTFEQDYTFLSSITTKLTNTKLVQSMTPTAKGKDPQRENTNKDKRGGSPWWLLKPFRRSAKKPKEKSLVALEDQWRRFSLSEIRAATNNFDEDLMIGGPSYFDKLYKGYIGDSIFVFAIRRFTTNSNWEDYCRPSTEILKELHQKLHHVQIPVGYCNDKGEMIVVYEYMGNGSLGDHLFRINGDHLPWKKRLEICIGVAQGLQQMHSSLSQILTHHVEINTNKIMLDNDWVPKFPLDINRFPCDTGSMYSEVLVPSNVATIDESLMPVVSTRYYAPEYLASGGVMKEANVYSLGVVLLDVFYGCNALNPIRHCGHWTSVDCFKSCMNKKCIGHIIDPYLMGSVTPECFREFVKIINDCLLHKRNKRPSMDDVVRRLEVTLELLETSGDHAQVRGASKDDQSEKSFKEAVCQAYNNALFNNNDPLFIDRDYIVMDPNATSFCGQLDQNEMSYDLYPTDAALWSNPWPASDDSDYHSSNLAR
ncbi:receptor-like protein kinase FERONIA [Rhododendron vialii]|uniref:receptor-like protein kinase FERONIA n=1 Tax=Rhododendron vialii TaxID=182163 RepID=UPI0026604212|nr:receptor-like protein kinase FERONIA [Rhododendron vialii]XP_058187728.1 receptor-like protein kinase FERONIA [Rhododendron vialii]